jgi:GTP-binding protein
MIVGQHARAEDLIVNVCKEKKLTNIRSAGEGVAEGLHGARTLSLEEAIEYLGDDELLEVTPKSIRLRKMYLSKHDRKRRG